MKKLIIFFLIMSLLCFASCNEDGEVTLPEADITTEALDKIKNALIPL
jgi:predicted small lipoprotein YifL